MPRLHRLLLGLTLLAAAGLLLRYDAGGPRWTVHSAHALGARTAAFADGGRLLVTVPHEPGEGEKWAGPVEVRETATGRLVRSIWDGETFRAVHVQKGRVAGLTLADDLRYFDAATGAHWRQALPRADYVGPLLLPNPGLLLVLSQDGMLGFDRIDGKPVPLPGRAGLGDIRQAPGLLLISLKDGSIALWDTASRRETGRVEPATGPAFEVSPDGNKLLARGPDKQVILWDISDRLHPRRKALFPADEADTICLTDDVALLLPTHPDGVDAIRAWDARTGLALWRSPLIGHWSQANPDRPTDRLLLSLAVDDVRALSLRTGKELWRTPGLEPLAESQDATRLAARAFPHHSEPVFFLDLTTGQETPCPLPPLTNTGNARFTPDGTLWLQATVARQPSPWWLPAWLAPTPEGHQRLFAVNADGRPTFTLAGRDLCGYLPLDDGSAVVTFHQHDGVQRMSLHDARHAPVWPRVAAALLGLAGVALLLAALWPTRGVTPAPDAPASGST